MNDFKYIKLNQPVGDMYLTKIPATKVIEISASNRRKAYNDDTGIQRNLDHARANAISTFCQSKDAMFPTPIILSAPSNKFKINLDTETIELPNTDEEIYCSIVDGQHRLKGIELSGYADKFELLVSFVFDTDPSRDAYLFSVINGNQKPVSKSLIYDLYGLSKARTIEKLCNKVMRELNGNKSSKMKGKIKLLGYKDEFSPEGLVSQATMIDALKKLITDNSSQDNHDIEFGNELRSLNDLKYMFRKDFIKEDEESIIEHNLLFFNAWLTSLEEVKLDNNKENFNLFEKSLGFSTSYKILQLLYFSWKKRVSIEDTFDMNSNRDFYRKSLKTIFENFFDLKLDIQVYSSSASGVNQLYIDIVAIALCKGIVDEQLLLDFLTSAQNEKIHLKMEFFQSKLSANNEKLINK